MVFTGRTGPTGQPRDVVDTFVFKDGTFVSRECEARCDDPATGKGRRLIVAAQPQRGPRRAAALISLARDLGLARTARLLARFDAVPGEARLAFLLSAAPNRLAERLLTHRHIALGLAINSPGNFLVGGGGGIAMMAGMSRLFSLPAVVVTVASAVAPVPVVVLLLGPAVMGK